MLCLPFPVSRFPFPFMHAMAPMPPVASMPSMPGFRYCPGYSNPEPLRRIHASSQVRLGSAGGEACPPPFSFEISAAVCSGCGSALYTVYRMQNIAITSRGAAARMYGKSHDLAMWVIPAGAKARHATGSLPRRLSLPLRPAPRAASQQRFMHSVRCRYAVAQKARSGKKTSASPQSMHCIISQRQGISTTTTDS